MLLMKLAQTGILEVSKYKAMAIKISLTFFFLFFVSGGFGQWTSDACVVVSKHGEHPVKCKCNQPAHFGLLFVSTYIRMHMQA